MKGGQAKKAGLTSKVPVHMTMNGSVFNAKANTVSSQNAKINNQVQTNQAGNVVRTNTAKSVSDIQNTQPAAKTEKAETKQQAAPEVQSILVNEPDAKVRLTSFTAQCSLLPSL